jgi:hypothetical protein
MLRGNYPAFTARLIREYADNNPMKKFPLGGALDWWESKLISAKQVRKWTRDELCQKIDSYQERLARLNG